MCAVLSCKVYGNLLCSNRLTKIFLFDISLGKRHAIELDVLFTDEIYTTFFFLIPKFVSGNDQPRQYIKKQRHYFANKGPSSHLAMVFPVVMYGCESWTIKKAEP